MTASSTKKVSGTETSRPRRQARARTRRIEPGTVLKGRFELIEEVGRGGLSLVYKARDLVAANAGLGDAAVALKIIVADKSSDPDVVALMHREARRLRDLVHPNIVRVYDMDVDGDAHFMVMEYLEGRSLAAALRETADHRLDPAQVDRLVAEASAALAYSHSRNIIHADLKPGNIFIEKTGQVKLIDFNIAYPIARPPKKDEEDTVQILGRLGAVTPLYASPQRLAGAEPGEGDDVFSLAVITYIALTGERPFGRKTAREAVEEKLTPEAPAGLNRARWSALNRGLALDDSERTSSVALFAMEFLQGGASFVRRLLRRAP